MAARLLKCFGKPISHVIADNQYYSAEVFKTIREFGAKPARAATYICVCTFARYVHLMIKLLRTAYMCTVLGLFLPFSLGSAGGQYGMRFLLDPINLAGFLATVLPFLIAIFGLISTLPAIKKLPVELSLDV